MKSSAARTKEVINRLLDFHEAKHPDLLALCPYDQCVLMAEIERLRRQPRKQEKKP